MANKLGFDLNGHKKDNPRAKGLFVTFWQAE